MRELYIEGVAIHGGPESCVGVREGVLDAIHGGRGSGRRVVDGERGGFPGFGLRVAGARRHLERVGFGSALPVTFC